MKKRHYVINGKIVEVVGATYNLENPCEGCCFNTDFGPCTSRLLYGLNTFCALYETYPELRENALQGLNSIFKEVH